MGSTHAQPGLPPAGLQVELSEYVDWVGQRVRGLDGATGRVARLEVRNGRTCLGWEDGTFSFGNESQLVRVSPDNPSFVTCPNCDRVFPREAPGHESGCIIGGILATIEDRGDLDLGSVDISTIDIDGLWERIGPLIDWIERELRDEASEE